MANVIITGLSRKQAESLSNFLGSECSIGRDYAEYFGRKDVPVPEKFSKVANGDYIILMKTYEPEVRLEKGTLVETIIDPDKIADDWTPEALETRRSGVKGKIVAIHDSHGLCYDVEYDDDHFIGSFEPHEIIILSPREKKNWGPRGTKK